ncbi:cold shock domain-containing protein [Marinobacter sp.]|uniref:cold shock domain-containing protein n=1 Tax=Marinobacter sp. TaxID=50741 RepID=UPI0019E81426|nr:cold shock domain-containing protein [Marinobacter sp.]MBE0484548.1 cold shock domain-containing protein [Marinobacter sp.]
MPKGKVKWFNNAKGYGFIIEDGCSDDLFAHFTSVQMEGYKTLKAGQPVTFEKKPGDKGIHAVNIVPDESTATQTPEIGSQQRDSSSGAAKPEREGYPPRAVNG